MALLAAACVSGSVLAQDRPAPQDTPTFRAEANLVRVDMYATLNGALVTDLRPEDVEVYEDGVRQSIQSFELIRIGAAAASEVAAVATDDSRTRIYVLNIVEWESIGRAHGEAFREIRPATSMVEVSRLIMPEMLVEIEADAYISNQDDGA